MSGAAGGGQVGPLGGAHSQACSLSDDERFRPGPPGTADCASNDLTTYPRTMLERERTLEQAEQHFLNELEKFDLTFVLQKFGRLPAQSASCNLFCRKTQQKMSEGWGKGLGQQCELSAKFEALELFASLPSTVSCPHRWLSFEQVQAVNLPIVPTTVFPELLSPHYALRETRIPWIEYVHASTGTTAWVPAYRTHPFYVYKPYTGDQFDYSSLYNTATTNGIASGCTPSEAMVHAILELIERHSISLFLIRTFLKKPIQPQLIDWTTLPQHLQQLIQHLRDETGYELLLFPLANELDVPVYGCLLHHDSLEYIIKGFGASLDPAYAAERALLEALETFHSYAEYREEVAICQEMLAPWPHFRPSALCDLPSVVQQLGSAKVPFTPGSSPTQPSLCLRELLLRMDCAQFNLYFNQVYQSENLTTVHAIIPEAEDFFMIEKGLITPFKAAGRAELVA
jgi:ribosomal protein S12 methylthiotransferase accessory factor